MNEFDQFVKHQLKAKQYIRYADDFVILSDAKGWLEEQVSLLQVFLSEKLRLTLHLKKLFIKTIASGVDFLGWAHFLDHRTLRTTTKRRMMKRLIQSPVEPTLNSYLGALRHGNTQMIQKEVLRQYFVSHEEKDLS